MAELDIPVMVPVEALRFFRGKGLAIGFAWQDIWQEEHSVAFTVAKAMNANLLEDIRAAVDTAIAEGQTLAEFSKGLRPTLEARGWWGKKAMVDPATGEEKIVQLGSPRRLETIFDTNMRSARSAGDWERFERTEKNFPFLRYTAVMDGRERPQHHAWNGTIKRVSDSWWNTHCPQCGWHCRCRLVAVNQRMMDRKGWSVTENPPAFRKLPYTNPRTGEVTHIEEGIDPGFNFNIGKARLDGLTPRPLPGGGPPDAVAAAIDVERGLVRMGVEAFLAAFDLKDGERKVFTDAQGWPLAISSGWFRDAGGTIRLPAGADAQQLALVGRAIAKPDSIVWRWVEGVNGRQLLMRRYLARIDGQAVAVDVGQAGWRFRLGKS